MRLQLQSRLRLLRSLGVHFIAFKLALDNDGPDIKYCFETYEGGKLLSATENDALEPSECRTSVRQYSNDGVANFRAVQGSTTVEAAEAEGVFLGSGQPMEGSSTGISKQRSIRTTQHTGVAVASHRKSIVIVSAAAAGLLAGATFVGMVDFLPTLVLPHGGWQHVSQEMWTRLLMFTAAGGTAGLLAGAVILAIWRS